jgi:hypothetical protein
VVKNKGKSADAESKMEGPNVVAKWLALLLHIWEDLGSNLNPETSYPEVFHEFSQLLQAYAGIGHDCFLPYPFPFINYPTIQC